MTKQESAEFAALLAGMAEATGKSLQPHTIDLYWEILQDQPMEAVREAAMRHLRSDQGRFFPKPVDLLQGIRGSHVDQVDSVYAKMRTAAICHGANAEVTIEDGIAAEAIKAVGGWTFFARNCEEFDTKRAFKARYRSMLTARHDPGPQTLRGGNLNIVPRVTIKRVNFAHALPELGPGPEPEMIGPWEEAAMQEDDDFGSEYGPELADNE